jgi:BMFP domain-containing protein YqiC
MQHTLEPHAQRRTASVQTKERCMNPTDFITELQSKVSELIKNSPAKDLEKNIQAVTQQMFQKSGLVTREEFDVQQQLLARMRLRLDELEARLATLEGPTSYNSPGSPGNAP